MNDSPSERLYRHRTRTTPEVRRLPTPVARFAVDAEVTDEHLVALIMWLIVGLGLVVGGWLLIGRLYGGVGLALVVVVPIAVAFTWSGRRQRSIVTALPDVVDMIGRSLRSGTSFAQALAEAAEVSPQAISADLQLVMQRVDLGQSISSALSTWAARSRSSEVRIVAGSLAVASQNEAGTSHALDSLGQSLRARADLLAEIRSNTAQATASIQALVLLPIGFIALDLFSGGHTTSFLLQDGVGRACLAVALLLDLIGWAWMVVLVRRRLPA